MSITKVPLRTKLLDDNGMLNRTWVLFLQSLGGTSGGGGGGTPVVTGGVYTVPILTGTATPDPSLGSINKIIVDQAVTIAAPFGTYLDGTRLTLWLFQHITAGGFQPVFDPIYTLGDYGTLNVDLGTFTILDLVFDTANWYIAGYPVMGQI